MPTRLIAGFWKRGAVWLRHRIVECHNRFRLGLVGLIAGDGRHEGDGGRSRENHVAQSLHLNGFLAGSVPCGHHSKNNFAVRCF